MKIINGWLDVAVVIDCTKKSMSRQGYAIIGIVLHGTAGFTRAEDVGYYFRDGLDQYGRPVEASTHFVIGRDGTIVQCVSLLAAAWGNCCLVNPRFPFANINWNWPTISIEHVKPHTDNSDELTPAQQLASFQLVKFLCEAFGIPKRRGDANGGILYHADLDSVNRARCPGPYPSNELFAYLNQPQEDDVYTLLAKDTSGHFTAQGDIWVCKNGKKIQGAILDFYRVVGQYGKNGLTDLGLPLADEIALTINKKQCWWQSFERGGVACDPDKVIDNPPGSGDCYKLRLSDAKYNPVLKKALDDLVAANNKVATSTKEIAEARKEAATNAAQRDSYKRELEIVKQEASEDQATLQKEIDALKSGAAFEEVRSVLTAQAATLAELDKGLDVAKEAQKHALEAVS